MVDGEVALDKIKVEILFQHSFSFLPTSRFMLAAVAFHGDLIWSVDVSVTLNNRLLPRICEKTR